MIKPLIIMIMIRAIVVVYKPNRASSGFLSMNLFIAGSTMDSKSAWEQADKRAEQVSCNVEVTDRPRNRMHYDSKEQVSCNVEVGYRLGNGTHCDRREQVLYSQGTRLSGGSLNQTEF